MSEIITYGNIESKIISMCITPDNKSIAYASNDNYIRIIELFVFWRFLLLFFFVKIR